mgnify:CR=1 FL=1
MVVRHISISVCMDVPNSIKIFHILHIDRLSSILSQGFIFSDSYIRNSVIEGTTIGMSKIKETRLSKRLSKYPDLTVGDCTPFYFCPRSVMLYMIYKGNHIEISYRGGQNPIIHIVADFHRVIEWAQRENKRWVFTPTNAAASYAEDFNDLAMLSEINWDVVNSDDWKENRGQKQAEFLIEHSFPIGLIEKIGVYSEKYARQVTELLSHYNLIIDVTIEPNWYY